jgi:hypothetical protein
MLSVARPRTPVRSNDTEHCRKRSAEARQGAGLAGILSRSIDRAPSLGMTRSFTTKPTSEAHESIGPPACWRQRTPGWRKTLKLRPRLRHTQPVL